MVMDINASSNNENVSLLEICTYLPFSKKKNLR